MELGTPNDTTVTSRYPAEMIRTEEKDDCDENTTYDYGVADSFAAQHRILDTDGKY